MSSGRLSDASSATSDWFERTIEYHLINLKAIASAEGDLKDIYSIPNGDLTGVDLDLFLDDFQEDEKFLFFTDFVFELR